MPLQCGTQWDSLAHVYYDGKMYNDRDMRLVTSRGAAKNGIEAARHGVVGRGVLLDFPRHLGVEWLEDGHAIRPEDLDACAEAQGVAIESGDILLVRTGMMSALSRAEILGGLLRRTGARPLGPLRRLAPRARDRGDLLGYGRRSRSCPPRRRTASGRST